MYQWQRVLFWGVAVLWSVLFCIDLEVEAASFEENGTRDDPIIIETAEDLDSVRDFLNNETIYFELGADIDLASYENWEPLGDWENTFAGHFNGNNHVIDNLIIKSDPAFPELDPIGLFGRSTGEIKKVHLESVSIKGKTNVGGITGINDGRIEASTVTGEISGSNNIGGLAGENAGEIISSSAKADVGKPLSGFNTGGIAGDVTASGSIVASFANGNIRGSSDTGGLAGNVEGSIEQSFAGADVIGAFTAGGLVGTLKGEITQSYAYGDVSSPYTAGGLVGENEGDISETYASGEVTIVQEYIGGVAAVSSGTIASSFWDTETSGVDASAGGEGKKTAEMADSAIYEEAGWDASVWDWPTGNYPKLKAIDADDDVDLVAPATATVNIEGGLYSREQIITLSGERGADIYYTLDGSVPTTADEIYTSPIEVEETTTLKAMVVDEAGNESEVLEETYTIDTAAPSKPAVDIEGGKYNTPQTIELSGEEGGKIYYTLDGRTPTQKSKRYESTIEIGETTTLKAIAVDEAGNESGVLEITYIIDTSAPESPAADPEGGRYSSSQTITLSGEKGAAIYYTLNDSTPTIDSTAYTGEIKISETTTLKAVAIDKAGNKSELLEERYRISKRGSSGSSGGSSGGSSSPSPDDDKEEEREKEIVSEVMGAEGGTLILDGAELFLPEGAVENPVEITIEKVENHPAQETVISDIFNFQKETEDFFSIPVTITLPYNKEEMEEENMLPVLTWFNEDSGEWEKLDNMHVDNEKETVSGEINHFTVFAVTTTPIIQADPYIQGYPDGTFRPNEEVTRAQMAVMLARHKGYEKEEDAWRNSPFHDITKDYFAFGEISYINQNRIMTGDEKNNFQPGEPITRAQMAVTAHRWITEECKKESAREVCETGQSAPDFLDISENTWAAESIAWAAEHGIMEGYEDHTFRPSESLTRAQAVKVLNQLFERDKLKDGVSPTFSDVPEEYWAYLEIESAVYVPVTTRDLLDYVEI
ncbi:chitobiase/beta-hexosaminidase C-terminal domain-containing protein [Salibacterium aidingense]|uniref:chitobiase/beta-hexosaminidase C-terminal domain-containing protein n=1 Tax=Salibacterium aidingense TaxID=384933 RepID=UPI003BD646FA